MLLRRSLSARLGHPRLQALTGLFFLPRQDQTVITTAVPKIANEFHAIEDVGWYTVAYLLTTSTFQVAYGKLFTTMSVKVVFLVAMATFEVGSIICAAAPNSTTLIVGRAVAGLGAAGLFPGSTLILTHTVPLERRPGLLGLMTGMFGVASLCGPFIGGAFADGVTWRWCFIINVPLGVVTAAVVVVYVRTPIDPAYAAWSLRRRVAYAKLPEILLLVAALICLVLALQWGGSTYPWNSGAIVALLVVFAVLALVFVGMQAFFPALRTVPTSIINNRDIWFGALFAACTSAAMFVAVTYLPIYFQAAKGASALTSGLDVMPLILGFLVFSILSGILTSVTGYYNPSLFLCTVFGSVGAGLLSTLRFDTPTGQWIGYQVLLGAGIGFGLQQPLLMAQVVLDPADVPFGVAFTNMMQMLGGTIFVAVSQNVFLSSLIRELPKALPGFDASRLLGGGVTDFSIFTREQLPIAIPIYATSLARLFYIVVGLLAATILSAACVRWRRVNNAKKNGAGGQGVVATDEKTQGA